MRKLSCSFILVLAIIAIFFGTMPAAAANGSNNSRLNFVDSVSEFFCLQNRLASVVSNSTADLENQVSLTGIPVSLPNLSPSQGTVTVPIMTGAVTGLGVISYDLQVTFDPAVAFHGSLRLLIGCNLNALC